MVTTLLLAHTGDNYLPFLEVGSTSDVTKYDLPNVVDASSVGVTIPGGFPLGITNQTLVYVSV